MIFLVLFVFGFFIVCLSIIIFRYFVDKQILGNVNLVNNILNKTREDLDSFIEMETLQAKQLTTAMITLGVILAFLGTLATFNIIVGIICGVIGLLLPRMMVIVNQGKRKSLFEKQLVTAIDIMANVLKAGGTPMQGIEVVYKEMEAPISYEFGILQDDVMTRGYDLSEALARLKNRMKSEELDVFIGATNLRLKEAGGSLAPIYDRIGETIRNRMEMVNKIDTIVSEGKMQAYIIGVAPLAIGGILMMLSPDYMRPLYSTTLGQILIGFMICLEGFGLWLVNKIITIDV